MDTTLQALSFGVDIDSSSHFPISRIQRPVLSRVQQGWKDFSCLWRALVGPLAHEKQCSFPVGQRPQDSHDRWHI